MSRITEALARAQGRPLDRIEEPPTSPWNLDEVVPPSSSGGWDFSDVLPAAAGPAPDSRPVPPPMPAALAARVAPSPAYAERLIGAPTLEPAVVEQYRRLGAALFQAQATDGVRVIMVASAMPAEGKTLVASNLALVLSGSYHRRVLLVDADLRRPSVHSALGLQNSAGIAESLSERRPAAPIAVTPMLDVLVAGTPQADPMRIVVSDEMRTLLTECRTKYDWVIVDTPPVVLLSDTHLLGAMVDRVLLVIHAGKTQYDVVQKSIEMIGRDRILGTVLNRADLAAAGVYEGAYYQHYRAETR